MFVLHQNSGGIGKSIPSALKIGRMRWICLFSLVLVEHGYIQGILGMELSVQLKTVIDWPKTTGINLLQRLCPFGRNSAKLQNCWFWPWFFLFWSCANNWIMISMKIFWGFPDLPNYSLRTAWKTKWKDRWWNLKDWCMQLVEEAVEDSHWRPIIRRRVVVGGFWERSLWTPHWWPTLPLNSSSVRR